MHQQRSSGQEHRTLHPLLSRLSSHPASVWLTPPEPSPGVHWRVAASLLLAASSSGVACASVGASSLPAPPSSDGITAWGLWELPQAATIAKTPKVNGIVGRTTPSLREAPELLVEAPHGRREAQPTLHQAPEGRRQTPGCRRPTPDGRREKREPLRQSPHGRREPPEPVRLLPHRGREGHEPPRFTPWGLRHRRSLLRRPPHGKREELLGPRLEAVREAVVAATSVRHCPTYSWPPIRR